MLRKRFRAILYDTNVYGPNVDDFDPERFLQPEVPDPTAAFGYGRRYAFAISKKKYMKLIRK